MSKSKLAVLIGRFGPFHNAHSALLQEALRIADNVVVLIGSSNTLRTVEKNPFSFEERRSMVLAAAGKSADRLCVLPSRDFPYQNAAWLREVQSLVQGVQESVQATEVILVGCDKDDSSYYLHEFPQWKQHFLPNTSGIDATTIRNLYFSEEYPRNRGLISSWVPVNTLEFLDAFRETPLFADLLEEKRFLEKYREPYRMLPYPPIFVTVDAVVVHSGHLLVVRRRANPGRGQWALPGGFIDAKERLLDSVLRELKEETRIALPVPVLRGSIVAHQVFDNPGRSQRGRTITHAYHFDFLAGPLPKIKGADDAEKARWMPLAEFFALDGRMYEDHWHIVSSFLGLTAEGFPAK